MTGELVYLETLYDGVDGAEGLDGAMALATTYGYGYAAGRNEDAVAAFEIAFCEGDVSSGDRDADAFCDDVDLCLGDDATGDADGDGLCADVDCDDGDAANVCLIFADGFEAGDTSAWSLTRR